PSSERTCWHGTSGVREFGPTRNATLAAKPGKYSWAIIGPGDSATLGALPLDSTVACDPAPSRGLTTTGNLVGSSPRAQVGGLGPQCAFQCLDSPGLSGANRPACGDGPSNRPPTRSPLRQRYSSRPPHSGAITSVYSAAPTWRQNSDSAAAESEFC